MLAKVTLVAALAASVLAGPCKPSSPPASTPTSPSGGVDPPNPPAAKPTLPSTGGADLPPVDAALTLKKIAIGHGLQNYTCETAGSNVTTKGALAVLYDVTALYPGTPSTGLDPVGFNTLTTTLLYSQDIPLNLVNDSMNNPGSPNAPNAGAESSYITEPGNPFIAPADLNMPNMAAIPFLGHHYFDATNKPTFDLTAAGLKASVGKVGEVKAPANADKGILNTGAVTWLYLPDNGAGLGNGVQAVYRVITAGGVAQPCSVAGAGPGNVPYTAFYWFFG